MHFAAEEGYAAIVKLLIEKGANVNATNKKGITPLDVTTNEKVKMLLKEKAKKLEKELEVEAAEARREKEEWKFAKPKKPIIGEQRKVK